MSMSKKHYEAIAEIINSLGTDPSPGSDPDHCEQDAVWDEEFETGYVQALGNVMDELSLIFKRENSAFDRDRFIKACGFPK